MEINKLSSENELYEKIEDENTILFFSASWCNPSKKLKELIKKFEDPLKTKCKKEITPPQIIDIDIDEYPELADKMKIKCVPHLITYQSGKIMNHSMGLKKELYINNLLTIYI